MKKQLRRILAMILACGTMLALAACGGGSGGEAVSEGAEGAERDTLIVAADREPVTLDPAGVNVTYAWLIESHIYDTLLKMDNEMNIVGDLAESWEQVDDLTWKFTLRKGVKFHNGEELTSKDVLYSFKRLYNEPAAQISVQFIDENGFETPDDYTFILKTTEKYAFLEAQLCDNSMSILNEKAVTEAGDDYDRNPIGTGPYQFVSWNAGDNITVERFDGYWGEAPLLKNIVFRFITENSARTINLESGDIDFCIDIQASDADRIANGENTVLVSEAGNTVRYFAFNCRHPVFEDKRVRQAMVHATDLETIRQVVYGVNTSTPSDVTPIVPGLKGRNTDLPAYEYNPEKARQLLEEAGVGDGFSVNYIYLAGTNNNMVAEMLQAMWQEVGVTLELNPMESGALSTAMNNAEQDFCLAGTTQKSYQTGKTLYDYFYSGSIGNTSNRSYLNSPEIDELLIEIAAETNEEARNELCMTAQEMINEECPLMVICYTNNLVGMSKDLRGFEYVPNGNYDLGKLYFE